MLAIIDKKPKKQCVLIVENGSLLGAGVERLLSTEAELRVIGVTAQDEATFLEIINHLRPDIVLLEETYFMALSIELLAKLLDCPHMQVMTVSANDDRVQIYYKQQILITHVADLIHLIREGKNLL